MLERGKYFRCFRARSAATLCSSDFHFICPLARIHRPYINAYSQNVTVRRRQRQFTRFKRTSQRLSLADGCEQIARGAGSAPFQKEKKEKFLKEYLMEENQTVINNTWRKHFFLRSNIRESFRHVRLLRPRMETPPRMNLKTIRC